MNKKQTKSRKRIDEMSYMIIKIIDKACELENYEIQYSEINAALIKTMKRMNEYELRELWKENQ